MNVVIPFKRRDKLSVEEVSEIHSLGFSTIGQGTSQPSPELSSGKKIANVFLPKSLEFQPESQTSRTIRESQKAQETLYPEKYRTAIEVPDIRIPFTKKRIPFTTGLKESVPKSDILTPILSKIGVFAAELPADILEAPVRVAKTLQQTKRVAREGLPSPTGEERFLSAFEIGGAISDSLKAKGTDPILSERIGAVAAGGIGVLDTLFVGGLLKSAIKAGITATGRQAAAEVAWHKLGRPASIKEAEAFRAKAAFELSPDYPRNIERGTADEALLKEINNAVDVLTSEGIPNKISSEVNRLLRTFEMSPKEFAEGGFRPAQSVQVPFTRVAGELPGFRRRPGQAPAFGLSTEEVESVGKGIPKDLDSLAQEARKYKSAEEFVKAQGTGESLYRGTTLSEWESIKQGGFSGKKISETQNRTWLADDIETAQGALKMRGGAGEVVIEFKPSARGKSFKDPNSGYYKADNLGIDDVARVTDKNGKVIYEATTGVKTKSQLTEIWEKANVGQKGILAQKPKSIEIQKPASPSTPSTIEPTPLSSGGIPGRTGLKRVGMAPEPPRKITKPEDVLLRKQIRDEARGAKIGYQAGRVEVRNEIMKRLQTTKAQITEMRADVVDYINTYVPSSLRGKFLSAIQHDPTSKRVASIVRRADVVAEEFESKKLIGEIKKISEPSSKMALEYQEKLTQLTEAIDFAKPTEATKNRLRSLASFLEANPEANIPKEYVEELSRLSKKPLSEISILEKQNLLETIKRVRALGKLKRELKLKYQNRLRVAEQKKLLESTKNLDPSQSLGEEARRAVAETKRVYLSTLHAPRAADILDGRANYKGRNNYWVNKIHDAELKAKTAENKTMVETLIELSKLVPDLDEAAQLRIMLNIRQMEGADDAVEALLKKNNLSEVPELNPDEEEFIRGIQRATNKNTDEIAAIYEEINNKPFERLDTYILPLKYEKEINILPSEAIEQTRFRTAKTAQGFTFARQEGVEKVPRTDVLGVLEEAVRDQEWYRSLQPTLEEGKYVFLDGTYKETAGEIAEDWWRTHIDQTARRGWSSTAQASYLLRKGRININRAVLGYRLSTIIMQPFAVFDSLAHIEATYGPRAMFESLLEFGKTWVKPGVAKEMIAKSPALQVRQGGEVAIEELLGTDSKFTLGAMKAITYADIKTAAGIEKAMYQIFKKAGATDEVAIREAEIVMNMTNGSSDVTYRPHILGSGEGARTLFTFQTFFLNRWGIVMDLMAYGSKYARNGEWKSLLRVLTGLGILMAGRVAEEKTREGISRLITGNDREGRNSLITALLTIPESIPVFGNLLEGAVNYGNSDFDFPLARTLENAATGAVGPFTRKTTEGKIKAGLGGVESISTLLFGIPGTSQLFDILERFVPEEPKKRTGGTTATPLGLPSLPSSPKLPKLPALPKL